MTASLQRETLDSSQIAESLVWLLHIYATFWTSHFVKNAASGSNRSAQSSPPDNPAAEWQTSISLVLPAYVLTPTTYPTNPGSHPPFVPSYGMSVHDPRAKLP